jgi:DNA-binding XRE family transcriptional regulator
MERKRIKLSVYVDLDPIMGSFHTAESAQHTIRNLLNRSIPHYNPLVSIESYDMQSFGSILISSRDRVGMSQETLAKLIGVSVEHLVRMEKGQTTPSSMIVTSVKNIFGEL